MIGVLTPLIALALAMMDYLCYVCARPLREDVGLCPDCREAAAKAVRAKVRYRVGIGQIGGPHDGAREYPKYATHS